MVTDGERLVQHNESENIQFGTLTHQLYTSKDDAELTVCRDKYYIPSESNNATFDAFFRCEEEQTGICLQMTFQTRHSLAESGLSVSEERPSAAKESYFIPKGQKFECKLPSPKWRTAFTFFILVLDDGKYYWLPLDL
jgi:hypothetical protein